VHADDARAGGRQIRIVAKQQFRRHRIKLPSETAADRTLPKRGGTT
jgi:hypothetical protein